MRLNSPERWRAHPSGEFIDEDVHRREEERVADPVQDVDENDDVLMLRQERKHREARRMAEDADDHRGAPAERLQRHPRISIVRISAICPMLITA